MPAVMPTMYHSMPGAGGMLPQSFPWPRPPVSLPGLPPFPLPPHSLPADPRPMGYPLFPAALPGYGPAMLDNRLPMGLPNFHAKPPSMALPVEEDYDT